MPTNMFKNIQREGYAKTYALGLLQNKAYKTVNIKTSLLLKPFRISAVEWVFLGMLHDQKESVSLKKFADILGVEAPFVTILASKFVKKRFVVYSKNPTDKRMKKITLTKQGHAFVIQIEKIISKESEKWLDGLSISQVGTFVKVLKKLTEKSRFSANSLH